jgi:hypothetical protein
MFARVFDKVDKRYYKSIIYGRIDPGWFERDIVYDSTKQAFVLADYIDKGSPKWYLPMIEVISGDVSEWMPREKVNVLELNRQLTDRSIDTGIKQFYGYEDVYSDTDFMLRILKDRIVPQIECSIQVREPGDAMQWTYIETQQDADEFFQAFAGFHDATLDQMHYFEDYGERRLTMRFDNSGWYGIAELCFEGLISMNLRPAQENFSREISCACLQIKDECVFWADETELNSKDERYDGTFVKALNLKWRKVE